MLGGMKAGYVYIMASGRNGTLYIGVTSELAQRVWQHREALVPGFTRIDEGGVVRLARLQAQGWAYLRP